MALIITASKQRGYNKRKGGKGGCIIVSVRRGWEGIHVYTLLGKQRKRMGTREDGTIPKRKKQAQRPASRAHVPCTEGKGKKQRNTQLESVVAIVQMSPNWLPKHGIGSFKISFRNSQKQPRREMGWP